MQQGKISRILWEEQLKTLRNTKMSESKSKPASTVPPAVSSQCCTSLTDVDGPALQVTSRMLRSPSHESVTTDLSLFSVSSIASDLRGVNRLVTFKSYTDVNLAGRGPSPKSDSRQIQSSRFVLYDSLHFTIYSCSQKGLNGVDNVMSEQRFPRAWYVY